jgi:hypothetical protein
VRGVFIGGGERWVDHRTYAVATVAISEPVRWHPLSALSGTETLWGARSV